MKGFVVAVIAAILSLFGMHPAPAHTASTPPSAQVASAVSAVEDPFHHVSNDAGTATPHSVPADSTPSPQTTVVKQYITQPVIERIIQSPSFASGLVLGASTDDTAVTLADLQNQINALANLPRSVFVPSFSGPAQTTPVNTATFAQGQRIDNLSGTSLSNITVNGVSGLTDADIPDSITTDIPYATSTDPSWYNYIAWGDSLTYGYGASAGSSYPAVMTSLLANKIVSNGGVNGETSTQIKTRMLAASQTWGEFTIIWIGHNNAGSPTTIKSDIAAMVDVLPTPKRFLVLSLLNGDYFSSHGTYGIGATDHASIVQLNSDLETLYPDNFLDIREYLVSQYNPLNGQDVTDHGNDIPPTSLRSDALHLNAAGYALVAEQVMAWIQTHDIGDDDGVVNVSDLVRIFANPPAIGTTFPSTGAFTTLTTSGNVGIGTTTPGLKLDVVGTHVSGLGITRFKGDSNVGYLTLDTTTGGSSASGGFLIDIAGTLVGQFTADGLNNVGIKNRIFGSDDVITIPSTGRVGIGTTTPAYKLDVNGDVNVFAGSAYKLNGVNMIVASTTLSVRPKTC